MRTSFHAKIILLPLLLSSCRAEATTTPATDIQFLDYELKVKSSDLWLCNGKFSEETYKLGDSLSVFQFIVAVKDSEPTQESISHFKARATVVWNNNDSGNSVTESVTGQMNGRSVELLATHIYTQPGVYRPSVQIELLGLDGEIVAKSATETIMATLSREEILHIGLDRCESKVHQQAISSPTHESKEDVLKDSRDFVSSEDLKSSASTVLLVECIGSIQATTLLTLLLMK